MYSIQCSADAALLAEGYDNFFHMRQWNLLVPAN
jgi:hypothetical protein